MNSVVTGQETDAEVPVITGELQDVLRVSRGT
jgi:hypothetical protein